MSTLSSRRGAKSSWRSWLAFGLLGALLQLFAFLYVNHAARRFEVKSLVMFDRPTVALPEYLGEVGSNRWIWVRDGLATKEVLITDSLLKRILEREPILQERLRRFTAEPEHRAQGWGEQAFLAEMRKAFSINFTGADVYSFWIIVQESDPQLALRMNREVLERLAEIEIKKPIATYRQAMTLLEQKLAELYKKESLLSPELELNRRQLRSLGHEIDKAEETLHQLRIATLLMNAEKSSRFTPIVEPTAEVEPVWPRPPLVHLAAALLTLFCGTLLAYLRILGRRPSHKGPSHDDSESPSALAAAQSAALPQLLRP